MIDQNLSYLVSSDTDSLWGLTVTTVGSQKIVGNSQYPPSNHPSEYLFNLNGGRILNEYQLLYITDGNGVLTYGKLKNSYQVDEGKMFLLMPGVWHSYKPVENSGWNEYWIGFKGEIISKIVREGFFLNQIPVFNIGLNEPIVDLYQKAINIANEERIGYQQALAGIVMHLLGLMYFKDKSYKIEITEIERKVNKAKIIMQESVYKKITAEDVAEKLNIGYSCFRRAFKEFTGSSPSRFMHELKLNEAKLLLSTTRQTAKQISYLLRFF